MEDLLSSAGTFGTCTVGKDGFEVRISENMLDFTGTLLLTKNDVAIILAEEANFEIHNLTVHGYKNGLWWQLMELWRILKWMRS